MKGTLVEKSTFVEALSGKDLPLALFLLWELVGADSAHKKLREQPC